MLNDTNFPRDDIASYYTSGTLWERLQAALRDDGVDLEAATL
ncbi:MAG: hypothetical protein ACI8PT_002028, partial [Gammaproteobacteria bacterium]